MTYVEPAAGGRTRDRFEAALPLLLTVVGIACSWWAGARVGDVRHLLSTCHNSDGAPAYVVPLGWAGVALGAAALVRAAWLVVAAFRRRSAVRAGRLHGVLVALLPVMVLVVAVQAYAAGDFGAYTHHRHHYCSGSAPLADINRLVNQPR
ncbi:hypothetical protein [Kitasatospora sp. NPDC097691]|uniref:hypothetical protein n=1 Tax=Kitasatospora sp. NPDC097691 TaxID=3157231 RepID=UPI003317BBD4